MTFILTARDGTILYSSVTSYPLSELCNQIFTGLPPRSRADAQNTGCAVPVVGIRALTHDGSIDDSAIESMEVIARAQTTRFHLLRNDLLLSIRGHVPKCAIVQKDFSAPTFASGNLAVIRPDPDKIEPSYLWTVMMQICRTPNHPLLTRASTQQLYIRLGSLERLPIQVPEKTEQRKIAETALALRDAVIAERGALEIGIRTFNSLLNHIAARHG